MPPGNLPHHPGHRQIGHGQNGLDAVDVLADKPQAAPHIDEAVHITKSTTVESLEHDLFLSDLAWRLK